MAKVMLKAPGRLQNTPALGPFPRYIWIHQATPPDDLDRACYEIWKQSQGLPDGLKPKNRYIKTMKTKKETSYKKVPNVTNEKDDITHMVEMEHTNLMLEHVTDCFSSMSISGNIDREVLKKKAQTTAIGRFLKSPLEMKDNPGKALLTKVNKPLPCNRFVVKAKEKSVKQGHYNTECSKIEAGNLLANSPVIVTGALNRADHRTDSVNSVDSKTHLVSFGSNLDMARTQTPPKGNKLQLPATKIEPTSVPPGFAPYACNHFPRMNIPRPPGFMLLPPSMVADARNYSYLYPIVPNQQFAGQHQATSQMIQMYFAQVLQHQAEFYRRQIYPVNPQQANHHFICVPHISHISYFQHVQQGISYQQRTLLNPRDKPNDASPMAGDGLQRHHPTFKTGAKASSKHVCLNLSEI